MCPEAPDRAEAASRALPLALPGGSSSAQRRGRGRSPAVLRTSPIQRLSLSPGLHQGCFQLIMGLNHYGDYSLWLFPLLIFCFQIL